MKTLFVIGVLLLLLFFVTLCNAQDTVRVQQTVKYENLIITIHDTVKVYDKKLLQVKVDSVDNFWKDFIILTNKEIQNGIDAWSKRNNINLYK